MANPDFQKALVKMLQNANKIDGYTKIDGRWRNDGVLPFLREGMEDTYASYSDQEMAYRLAHRAGI